MDLFKAQKLAKELINEHNLSSSGWWFSFDYSKSRFGVCDFTLKKISLSKHLVVLNDETQVRNTILHEIAHALVGYKHGHDAVWRAKAIEIGCDGSRCYTSEVTKPQPRYIGTCPNGHTVNRFKISKQPMSCARCCNEPNPKYLITWKLNNK
jgi:hypothetical protein